MAEHRQYSTQFEPIVLGTHSMLHPPVCSAWLVCTHRTCAPLLHATHTFHSHLSITPLLTLCIHTVHPRRSYHTADIVQACATRGSTVTTTRPSWRVRTSGMWCIESSGGRRMECTTGCVRGPRCRPSHRHKRYVRTSMALPRCVHAFDASARSSEQCPTCRTATRMYG